MRASLLDFLRGLRATYWFVPGCMALAAVLASLVTLRFDALLGSAWFSDRFGGLTNRPDGARAVLSTVAGSMITVAGVTFSMTIASVSYAAGQLGPRLMTNFMRDRGNQYTLGTFIATFLYSLMILRTVRSGTDDAAELEVATFVPQLSVLCSLALALASTAVLIFFIHHVPESINAQNITARIGRELVEAVDEQFPGRIGDPPGGDALPDQPGRDHLPAGFGEQARAVGAARSGYVRAVDDERLLELCQEHNLVVRLLARPGDFVVTGQDTLLVWPPERFGGEDEDLDARCRGLFSLGGERTHHQNLLFLVDELVEIAARAVSPGINDPFTAITAIDWLRSGLTALCEREPLSPHRFDPDGVLRVVARPTSFEEALTTACEQLRPYVAADRNAALRVLKMLGHLALHVDGPTRRGLCVAEAERLADATDASLPLAIDRASVRKELISIGLAARGTA